MFKKGWIHLGNVGLMSWAYRWLLAKRHLTLTQWTHWLRTSLRQKHWVLLQHVRSSLAILGGRHAIIITIDSISSKVTTAYELISKLLWKNSWGHGSWWDFPLKIWDLASTLFLPSLKRIVPPDLWVFQE